MNAILKSERRPIIKGKRFIEEQIGFAMHQAESEVPVVDICRKMEVSEATFYRSKKKFARMLHFLRALDHDVDIVVCPKVDEVAQIQVT